MANSVGSTGATGVGLGGANFALGLDSTQLEQGLASVKAAVEQQTQTVQQELVNQQGIFTSAHNAIRSALDATRGSAGELSKALTDITQIALGPRLREASAKRSPSWKRSPARRPSQRPR